MKKIIIYLFSLLLIMSIFGCTDWVQNTDPYIDQVKDEDLNDQVEFTFLIRGVQQRFATSSNQLSVLAGGLSDELFFSYAIRGASFDDFADIDQGDMKLDNTSASNAYYDLGEARFFADDLIRRTKTVAFTDSALMRRALYTGYLYGGIARTLYANYYGLTEMVGGSPIDKGPFIDSETLYDNAIARFTTALSYAASNYDVQVVNSLIARAYLYKAYHNSDYSSVQAYADNGLAAGASTFEALFHDENAHSWFFWSGAGRTQYALDNRFVNYQVQDSTEENRIPVFGKTGWDGQVYYFQDKYPDRDSPFSFMSWQENNLMLAELAIRNSDDSSALTLINAVRESHGVQPLAVVDMDALIAERDKELMCTGARLMDQRRFNIWHLPAGSWQYLPISLDERNANPNID